MKKELSATELKELLLRLCEDEALELIPGDRDQLYIPFVMNDAVEAYCTLTDIAIPGSLPEDMPTVTEADIITRNERSGIVLKCSGTIEATVWYSKCLYEENYYQYHRIMHCWVKGQEHMRMLVNTIGTMRDKYEYLSPSACNETEISLIPLLEYRPFRSFSPIKESIDSWYPETEAGYETMRKFAGEAGDRRLLHLMQAGRLLGKMADQKISRQIAGSEKLFWILYRKVCEASGEYDERIYNEDITGTIRERRRKMHEAILCAEYNGVYPRYEKLGSRLLVFEEHPFTISQMDNMEFDLHILEYVGTRLKEPFKVKNEL